MTENGTEQKHEITQRPSFAKASAAAKAMADESAGKQAKNSALFKTILWMKKIL